MLENKRAETLRLLRESGENVSGQDLCEHFGISRTAVWKIMNQLKEEGYEIEAVQNKGYRLLNEPDLMTEGRAGKPHAYEICWTDGLLQP